MFLQITNLQKKLSRFQPLKSELSIYSVQLIRSGDSNFLVICLLPMTVKQWSRVTGREVRRFFLTVSAKGARLADALALRAGQYGPGIVGARCALAGVKLIHVLQQGPAEVAPLGDGTWDSPHQVDDWQSLWETSMSASFFWKKKPTKKGSVLTLVSIRAGLSTTELAQFL